MDTLNIFKALNIANGEKQENDASHKILWATLMQFSMVRRATVSQICETGKRNLLFNSVYVSNVNEYVYNI